MTGSCYLLFESASGYALFERVESEEIGSRLKDVQRSISDLSRFSKLVKLKAFLPFASAEEALEAINAISEGEVTGGLAAFLEQNLPKAKPGKKSKYKLLVQEAKLGNVVQETMGIRCESDDLAMELFRGVRQHFTSFVKGMSEADLLQAELGLSHSFSRSTVKFNVQRADNMIIQAIAIVDALDKDLNTFSMRVREWYGWHFPELARVVPDSYTYCRLASSIGNKSSLDDESVERLAEITGDKDKAQEVLEAARMSMGSDISEIDLINIERFATRVVKLSEYRQQVSNYLASKMEAIAPSTTALVGDRVGARLLAHAGSLVNLAKYPASTVQILGAEKALFRALKTKGATPKYGLIFHSSFVGRAGPKNKGRISRYLANKLSIASRVDAFSEEPTAAFGVALRDQVEERLAFFKTGKTPTKNADAMAAVVKELGGDITRRGDDDGDANGAAAPATPSKKEKKSKKEKSSKKRKRSSDEDDDDVDGGEEEEEEAAPKTPKSSSKKEKKSKSEKKSSKKKSKKARKE